MRKYLFGTGILTALVTGLGLLRALRDREEFTWRTGLAWVSWGISAALAIGAIVDVRRAVTGHVIDDDSPIHGRERKLLSRRLRG